MNLKTSNSWQKTMYGKLSAAFLNSPLSRKQAREQTVFLIQTLGLKKGGSLLDIPCGTGRHTLAFAKKGFSVTGVDINSTCLKAARKNCQGINHVQIKKGNMAKLAWAEGKFDIVLNMFSSFGYFKTDRENTQVLKGFVQALKPGGRLVLQTIRREWVLSEFLPFSWEKTPQMHILTKRFYHPKTKYLEAHQVFLCKKSRIWEKSCHRIRLYSIPEMKTLLKKTGLKKIKILEEAAGKSLHRPIYTAEAPK